MATILVVEDSPDQARLIAALLEANGFTTEIAFDGTEALEAMDRNTPDLVATDLIMPGLNGLEVVCAIKQRHPHVPVILMTAFGSAGIAKRALEEGAASYVPKKKLREELIDTVRSTLVVARASRDHLPKAGDEHAFVLGNDETTISPILNYVQEAIRSRVPDVGETELMQLGIAIQEAVLNAMHHGNLEVGSDLRELRGNAYRDLIEERRKHVAYRDRKVHFEAKIDGGELTCTVKDEGPGFDPAAVPDPTNPDNLDKVSGRGLYLIWTFMDRIAHNSTGNEITMTKRLEGGDGEDS